MNKNLFVAIAALTFALGAPITDAAAPAGKYKPFVDTDYNPYPLPPGPPAAPTVDDGLYAQAAVGVSLAPGQTSTYLPPAGTVLAVSQGNLTTDCLTVPSVKTPILATDVTTGPASSYIEINYSGQFAMGATTMNGGNRAFIQCAIRLASQTPADDVACPAMSNAYIVARRENITGTTNYPALTRIGSYVGAISGLFPNTKYTITMYAYTAATPAGDFAQVCYSNMILRY